MTLGDENGPEGNSLPDSAEKSVADNSQKVDMEEKNRRKREVWRQGKRVTRSDFASYMRTARGGKDVTCADNLFSMPSIIITYYSLKSNRLTQERWICSSIF